MGHSSPQSSTHNREVDLIHGLDRELRKGAVASVKPKTCDKVYKCNPLGMSPHLQE